MNVRFQRTARGEVAILPRKEYEALVAEAAKADEDRGTARLVNLARDAVALGAPLLPKEVVDRLAKGDNAGIAGMARKATGVYFLQDGT